MLKLGVHCVKRAVSGADLTDSGKAACASLLLVLSCALSPAFAQASEVVCPEGSQAMTGSGTESTPYQVTDICQLQGISSRPAAYYVLMDNIDASTTKDWNGGAGFRPIASTATDGFSGSFVNPGSYEISLLTISRSTETYVGLFSRLAAGATIRGVILLGSRTTGRDSVGSLVGFSDGVIDNSSATGSVFGQSNVGGLVGFSSSRSSIDNSYATGSVSGVSQVGGVVGNNFGSINYTYATSTVIGTGSIVGGLVGFSRGDISDSYATGSVSGGSLVGGLVGFINSGDISDSYATGSVSGDDAVGGLTGYQDFGIGITDSYATGPVSGGDRVGGLTGFQEVNSSITGSYATGSVIGRTDNVGGLVGDQERDSSIRESYATGSVSGDNHVGGLVGNSLGFISSSSATGLVSGTGDNIGGLVGNSLGFIRDSHAASAVTGQFSVGGLVGNSLGFISNSSATGSVFGTGGNIGGLVGNQEFSSSIRDSYATGSVSGDYFIGGFVGNGLGFVSNSYATGSVLGDYFVGGLVGFLGPNSSIRDSYATGSVSGDYSVGGLVGRGNGNIANSYYATRGWINGLGEERTFTQLRCPTGASASACPTESPKSSYQGWDAGVWDFGSATDLPQLSSNLNSDLNRKPYIKTPSGSVDIGNARVKLLSLEADYLGSPPGEPVTLTWSLFGVPSSLRHLVYFDLGGGTTSTTFTDSVKPSSDSSTIKLVVNGELAGKSFDVVLKNNVSANDDRIRVRIAGMIPLVTGGEVQTRTIADSSFSSLLDFEAFDRDDLGSDGAGLSWSFLSTDIAEGSTVRFSGTTEGGAVKVEVVRSSLDFYDVGSFVLEIESPAGAKTTVTVTIETKCSLVPGEDLMTEQSGAGTSGNPYQIRRLCQLQDVRSNLSAYYELAANIDASRTRDWNDGAGFEPIASTPTDGFSGSFVSTNNYVISSLTISRSDMDYVGLFSRLAAGATIRGIILVGSRTTGRNNVGSLVGLNSQGVIEDSSATGFVSGSLYVGGLVGWNYGNINNGYAAGSISEGNYGSVIGGLVGQNTGAISSSYATGSVSGRDQVGGLVGNSSTGAGAHISSSYATGSVSGREQVGGLVGIQGNNTSIRNSYATGSVFGTGEGIGGLVGAQDTDSTINNSYATGSVFGTGEGIGGLVGIQGNNSSIVNSYYPARGRNNGLGEERTFAQLRCPMAASATCPSGSQENTYGDWDANVWDFGTATELPQLSSNRNSDLNLKPYIKSSPELVVVASFPGIMQLSLEADYPGPPGESVALTWSLLFDESSTLGGLVYFELGDSTTSKEANGSVATLVAVRDDLMTGKGFYVVLKNNISANDDRVRVRIVGESPLVDGEREQIRTIQDGLLSNILSFSATDPDNPYSDDAGLSWSFLSTDISEGSTVRFSGTTRGGTVEVEVVRSSLDFYDVGSFVLEVKSPVGVDTTFTVTIETVCSTVPGEDLMTEEQSGAGTSDNPYQIRRICQLQDVSSSPTAYYELAADIDASRTRDWNDGAGFEPIASTPTDGFSGSFVSTNNYVISSLTISRSDTDYVGLFSRLAAGATIRGIVLVGSRTTGRNIVGSLVGLNSQGVIEDSSATGFVSGSLYVGGLVGWNTGNINNGYAAVSVSGISGRTGFGGLVGQNVAGAISRSFATGSVFGGNQVGGLVGENNGGASVSNSYATGSVSGAKWVGGLVGLHDSRSNIRNSYATGSVSGRNEVGGLVGEQGINSSISDSYATGSVSGRSEVGGLVGRHGRQFGSSSIISNSYATGSVFGTGERVGGLVGEKDISSSIVNSYYAARGRSNSLGEERTFAQLRCPTTVRRFCLLGSQENTYGDWDANVWDFGSATELPQLSSNRNSDLNLKPYVKGSADLVVATASTGVTKLSLEADYLGPPGESVTLTWSLSGVSTSLRDLVYFDLGGGSTSRMFTDPGKPTSSASTATLVVVGSGLAELVGKGFYVVLRNNISGDVDRIPIQVLQEAPTALTRPLRVKVYLGGAVR